MYERKYVDKLPIEVMYLATTANIIYKKEIKFGLGHGYYADIRDRGTALLGVKVTFP